MRAACPAELILWTAAFGGLSARCSDANEFQEILGIPIGEAKAAVRFGAANLLRIRRAMNAVAGFVEPDPGDADGIIRAGRDYKLRFDLPRFGRFRKNFGIECV